MRNPLDIEAQLKARMEDLNLEAMLAEDALPELEWMAGAIEDLIHITNSIIAKKNNDL